MTDDPFPSLVPVDDGPPAPNVAGRLVYAVGDIHGRYDLLKPLIRQILADSRSIPTDGAAAMLIFCGDYVDRGAQSAQVVEAMIWLGSRPEFELRLLKGNHEAAMLAFIARPEEEAAWLGYGGAETLESYGVRPPDDAEDAKACIRARDDLVAHMPAAHRRLLEGLETMVVVGDYAFVHAGIRPEVCLEAQQERDLLWIRGDFIDAPGPFEKIIVHGHTWRDRNPQVLPHRIGIDTGAYATGVLTAARFAHGEVSWLQASDAAA